MLYKLILLQLTAHLFADFIFQSQEWSDKKGEQILTKYHIYHVLVVFVFSYLFSLDLNFWWASLLLSVFHLITDIFKSYMQLKHPNKNYFFSDQIIHLLFLSVITIVYNHFHSINFLFDIELKTIAVFAAFVFCTKPSNILVKYIFIAFSINSPLEKPLTENNIEATKVSKEKSLPNAGKLIGIVERLLALALILSGQYGAVGLIIAAKSILRFNDTQKAEYVLVGTLLSFGIAAFLGISINLL